MAFWTSGSVFLQSTSTLSKAEVPHSQLDTISSLWKSLEAPSSTFGVFSNRRSGRHSRASLKSCCNADNVIVPCGMSLCGPLNNGLGNLLKEGHLLKNRRPPFSS